MIGVVLEREQQGVVGGGVAGVQREQHVDPRGELVGRLPDARGDEAHARKAQLLRTLAAALDQLRP